jgi:hypothetical protein
MRLPVSRILLLVCALLAVVPATAGAATAPKVTSVAPLKLKIGERLTIRGRGFLPGKNRNTVVFKAAGGRAVFAKAESATTTKLVVTLAAKLAAFLGCLSDDERDEDGDLLASLDQVGGRMSSAA